MTFVKAGLDGLIPFIIAIFWVIAQVAGNSAKKKSKTPPDHPVKKSPYDHTADTLQNLLHTLENAQSPLTTPQTPSQEKIESKPCATEYRPEAASDLMQSALASEQEMIQTPEAAIRPTMKAFRNSLPAMKLPSMKLHFQCATHHDRDVDSGKRAGLDEQLGFNDRKTLRRAMISHIILDKPKGLGR